MLEGVVANGQSVKVVGGDRGGSREGGFESRSLRFADLEVCAHAFGFATERGFDRAADRVEAQADPIELEPPRRVIVGRRVPARRARGERTAHHLPEVRATRRADQTEQLVRGIVRDRAQVVIEDRQRVGRVVERDAERAGDVADAGLGQLVDVIGRMIGEAFGHDGPAGGAHDTDLDAMMPTRQSTAREAPRAAAREDDSEPPYEGEAGRTRLEPIHVLVPTGQTRSIRVYRAVNVGTDPELRGPTLAGGLHRFETGEELAIPFVYHDPSARRMVLVVPESLRHEELRERAKLWERIAADTAQPVPRYVREFGVVIGVADLAAWLDRAEAEGQARSAREQALASREQELRVAEEAVSKRAAEADATQESTKQRDEQLAQRAQKLDEREQLVAQREAKLAEREQRLHARAEDVTRREDELATSTEELEARERELQVREQELEARVESVRQRELDVAQRAAAAPVKAPATEDDVEEVEEIEPLRTNPHAEIGGESVEMEEEAPTLGAEAVEDVSDDDVSEEAVEDEVDDVEEISEIEPVEDTGVGIRAADTDGGFAEERTHIVPPGAVAAAEDGDAIVPAPPAPPTAKPAPSAKAEAEAQAKAKAKTKTKSDEDELPASMKKDATIELRASIGEGGAVRLAVRLAEGQEAAFREGALDLLAQLVVVQGYPVVLLALVAPGDDRPQVRRGALDPRHPDDKKVLEALRRAFRAQAALFSRDGKHLVTRDVASPREVNVAMLLERIARMPLGGGDSATAVERALAAPPPVREVGHPFQADASESASARGALESLERLIQWSAPEKLDRALLALSIPRDVVDAAFRRVLDDAMRFGLALPDSLRARAVSLGVAGEPGELVGKQIQAFLELTSRGDRGGLGLEEVATNWEQLLSAAADNEVAIDAATHDRAWQAIRASRGESSGSHAVAEIDASKIPDMGPPELVLLLEHPKARRLAALEICRRRDTELVDTLYKAVRKMPRADVVCIVPKLVGFGEAAGDALIDGLSARKTFVRQASALALGELKLRRAVVPLVHLLQSEPSDVWHEVARVLGEFGMASFRTLSRVLKDPKTAPERFPHALAHLAVHGCLKQVEELAHDSDPKVAKMAQEALDLRDDAKGRSKAVRGDASVETADAVRQFSRRFYQELAGTAPKEDLAGPSD